MIQIKLSYVFNGADWTQVFFLGLQGVGETMPKFLFAEKAHFFNNKKKNQSILKIFLWLWGWMDQMGLLFESFFSCVTLLSNRVFELFFSYFTLIKCLLSTLTRDLEISNLISLFLSFPSFSWILSVSQLSELWSILFDSENEQGYQFKDWKERILSWIMCYPFTLCLLFLLN
jgi:hypothetical protein